MIFTCKQVSRTLENSNYEDLSKTQKSMLQFHVGMCIVCGKYNRQVVKMHQLYRRYREHEAEVSEDVVLRPEIKENLEKQLNQENH
jgi:hypothetical protein